MRPPDSRRVLLLADAVFGVLLIVAALAPAVPRLFAGAPPPPQATAAEVAARFAGLSPPGQTIGFAIAADGSLGIVDRGRGVVMHLDADGRPVAEWGPHFGNGLDAQDLVGLAAAPDGWYVLDRGAQRILHLSPSGQADFDRTIDLQPFSPYGPNGIGADSRGRVFVADTGRDRLLVFDSSGRMVTTVGDSGSDLGKLKQPMGVGFAPDGTLLVADWENNRIERFDADLRALNYWPLPSHAWGVTADRQGRVYVPDGDKRVVRAFTSDGQQLFQIGGEPTALPLEFPSQVALSADGNSLWVLGGDGLVRADLRPYAAVQALSGGEVRWPLALLGFLLLALAAVIALRPTTLGRPRLVVPGWSAPPAVALPPAAPPTIAPSAPPRLALHLPTLPTHVAVLGGGTLIVLGAIGAVSAELQLLDPVAQADPWPRMALLTLSCLVCSLGVAMTTQVAPLAFLRDWPHCAAAVRTISLRARLNTAASLVPAVILAAGAAILWWTQRFQTPEATRGALLWLLAIIAAAVVIARQCQWQLPHPTIWTLLPWLLYALALVPRITNQAELPWGVWYDEAQAGTEARRLWSEARYTPITDTYGRDASLFYYFIAIAQQFIADPVVAGRAVAALIGALNAPLIYLLGREVWGWRVGLAAGVLLAGLRWHLDVSRLGWDPISLPVCITLACWLLARAIRRERWTDAAWAGMAFGLGLHAYIGFRAMPVVAVILLAYGAWLRRWSSNATLARFAIFMAGLVLVALPVLIFALQDPASFNGRLNQTLILYEPVSNAQKLDEVWSNVQKHALMFHVHGDMNGRHNLPGWPMLDPFSGILAMLGFTWLLLHLFDWRSWLIFGWGAVSLSGGIFTLPFEAPQGMRSLGITPALALLVALGLVLVLDRCVVAVRNLSWLRPALASAAALLIAWIAVLNTTQFFTRQMQDPTVWESFSTRETVPMRAALDRTYEAILGSPTIAPSIEAALLPPNLRDTIHAFDVATDLPYRGSGPALIVLETEHDAALVDEVMRFYPDAQRIPIIAPNGNKPLVEEVLLERDVLAAHHGLAAVGNGAWRTLLALDAPGAYRLAAPAGMQLTIDGSSPVSSASFDLARGNHLVELRGVPEGTQSLELRWQPPGATQLQTVDPRSLFLPPEGGTGLAVTFFARQTFEGTPQEHSIDPLIAHYFHTNPFARVNFDPGNSWSAEWNGVLEAPATGTYRFEADRLSRAGLWIDNRQVFDDTAQDAPVSTSGTAELTAGAHDIRIRFQDRMDGGPRVYLYWTPPGGNRQVLPGSVLLPPPATAQ